MTQQAFNTDTIAAIATASGEAGISVVRLSGPESLRIADEIFRGSGPAPSRRSSHVILHGHITSSAGADVDEVLLLIMRAPHSYTCEDVVEVQGHGGTVSARRILRRTIEAGARLADPGEFTRRAFLNGRIDLIQAEAVLDLVRSTTDRAAAAAIEQLAGALSKRINSLYDLLLSVAADIEATLDFPEDELPTAVMPELCDRLARAEAITSALLTTWDEGHLLREGAVIVITGRPNVGKSTMMNTLLGRNRSIVSPRPGTTRDSVEETLILGGISARIVDTAGLRASECDVEQEGIRRTRELMQTADIHLHVIDSSQPLEKEDEEHVTSIDRARVVIVLNKSDLGVTVHEDSFPGYSVVTTSLLDSRGGEVVREAITAKLQSGFDASVPLHAVISERHRKLLLDVLDDIHRAKELAQGAEDQLVPAAETLRTAVETLGLATGRTFQEDLLATVFSRFCIGK